MATRHRPSLDGMRSQLSNSSLQEECVTTVTVSQVTPDTAVPVTISPVSSPSQTMSPSRNVLMEEMLAAQHKRRQHDNTDNMVPTSPTSQSFQDQLKSKLEARKRSLEGGDTHDSHHHPQPSHQQSSLPLSEAVTGVSYKVRKPTPPVHNQVLAHSSSPHSSPDKSSSSSVTVTPPHHGQHGHQPAHVSGHQSMPAQTVSNPYIQTAGKMVNSNQQQQQPPFIHGHNHFVGKMSALIISHR